MNIKCGKSSFFYLVAILNFYEAFAAASEKREVGYKLREFIQSWDPTDEVSDLEEFKQEDENKRLQEMQKKHETVKNSNSNYKTICEDKSGNCGPNKIGSEDNLEQLIVKIQEVLGHEDKMVGKDVMQLRQLVSKAKERIHDIQKSKCSQCGESHSSSPVRETGERHVKEKIVIHAKKHHDHHDSNEKNSHARHHIESHSNNADAYRVHQQLQQQPKPAPVSWPSQSNQKPQTPSAKKFLQALVPDVNYNGGIPLHMDELKRQYPQGYWPPNIDNEENDGSKKLDDDDNDGNEKDYEVLNLQDHIETRRHAEQVQQDTLKVTTENALSPEYLEDIIRQEQILHKKSQKQHHVVEHRLPRNNAS